MLFDNDHEAFRDTVRRYASKELAGGYLQRAAADKFPRKVFQAMAARGLLGLGIPTEFGGQGADPISIAVACEEIAHVDPNAAYFVFNSAATGGLLSGFLPEPERDKWARATADGTRLTAVALTEPECGSDAAAIRTSARPVAGGWELRGEKTSVTLAPHADAALVFAKTAPELGAGGVTCFLVDLDDDTIHRHAFRDPGFRPIGRGSITLDDTFVPAGRVLGELNRGFHLVMGGFDFTRSLLGLMSVATATSILDQTIEYTKDRHAFGRPVSTNQGVSFTVAEHATLLEAARWLCYRAIALRAAGLPHTKEAAMCKWWPVKVAFEAINDCVVLHGHVGWSEDMPLQQALRDVSGLQIGDGTPQIQKLVIARHLFGHEFV